ncbi:MAG: hypothetical protein EOP45_21515, partial [Sphingobacteriaceae bacterium]
MEDSNYTVLLGLGAVDEKVIYSYAKDYKLLVRTQRSTDFPGQYALNFFHLDDNAKDHIAPDHLEQWLDKKGIDIKECEAAASWYVLERQQLDELRYAYPNMNLGASDLHQFAYDAQGNR